MLCASSNIAVDMSTDRRHQKSGRSCGCCPEEGGCLAAGCLYFESNTLLQAADAAAAKKAQDDAAAAKKKARRSATIPTALRDTAAPQANELRRAEDERKAEERRAAEVHVLFNASFPILTVASGCRSRAQG